jgi:hypothetical protein
MNDIAAKNEECFLCGEIGNILVSQDKKGPPHPQSTWIIDGKRLAVCTLRHSEQTKGAMRLLQVLSN